MTAIDQIIDLGNQAAPREACGYLFGDEVLQVRNMAPAGSGQFLMHPADQLSALQRPEQPTAVWHTHPGQLQAVASLPDIAGCNRGALPWLIVAVPSGDSVTIEPNADIAPLKGRPYCHGVFDCLTLILDYYSLRGTPLPQPPAYSPHWYRVGDQLTDHIAAWGFERIRMAEAQQGDILLFRTRPDSVAKANHMAIFLGGNLMLEQDVGVSRESVFDPHSVIAVLHYRGTT